MEGKNNAKVGEGGTKKMSKKKTIRKRGKKVEEEKGVMRRDEKTYKR